MDKETSSDSEIKLQVILQRKCIYKSADSAKKTLVLGNQLDINKKL